MRMKSKVGVGLVLAGFAAVAAVAVPALTDASATAAAAPSSHDAPLIRLAAVETATKSSKKVRKHYTGNKKTTATDKMMARKKITQSDATSAPKNQQ